MNYQKIVSDIQSKRDQISQLTQAISQAKTDAKAAIESERIALKEQMASLKVAEREVSKA